MSMSYHTYILISSSLFAIKQSYSATLQTFNNFFLFIVGIKYDFKTYFFCNLQVWMSVNSTPHLVSRSVRTGLHFTDVLVNQAMWWALTIPQSAKKVGLVLLTSNNMCSNYISPPHPPLGQITVATILWDPDHSYATNNIFINVVFEMLIFVSGWLREFLPVPWKHNPKRCSYLHSSCVLLCLFK